MAGAGRIDKAIANKEVHMNTAIIEKVQKLLKLGNSSNMNEAMAATAIANRLIDEHRLSMADLSEDINDPIMKDDSSVYTTGRITAWKQELIWGLAHHYGCNSVNVITRSPRKISHFYLIGKKADIEIVRYMFSFLTAKCDQLSMINAKGKGHQYVSSYCMGFVFGVMEQLKESREVAKKNATSTAIVAIDSRVNASIEFTKTIFKNLKDPVATKAPKDHDGFYNGVKSGKSIHLGSALNS